MRRLNRIALRLTKGFAVALVITPFILCWCYYYAEQTGIATNSAVSFLIMGLFLALYIAFCRVYDAFALGVNRLSEIVYSQALAVVIADGFMFVVLWILMRNFPALWPALITLGVQLVVIALWATLSHFWFFKVFPPRRSAVVYHKRYGIQRLVREYGLEQKFDVQWTVPATDCIENLKMLDGIQTVFIDGVSSHERNIILKYCAAKSIDVYVLPRIGDVILSGAKHVHMFHLPMLHVNAGTMHPEHRILKRLLDILISAAVLLLTSPVMLATAIAIKAHDGGPVFYKQARLTRGGRIFKIVKFRSMRVDAEKDGVARLSAGDHDDRITPVGKIIRKLRIDELPQLFNVLGGSMSIVGPRPERPEIARQYEKELPEFRLRLKMKAGLTGYAQVYGKYNTTPYDKLQMDLMYIANPSLLQDLRILFATVKILFVPDSTEGIQDGATTAMKTEEQKQYQEAGK